MLVDGKYGGDCYFDEEEGDAVSAEGSGRFDVGHFGLDLGQCGVFLVLAEDLLLDGLDLDVRLRQELFQTVRIDVHIRN